ncbi:MAG: polymer-forming cytoskeletal protein [Bacteroidales bacterium]
MAKTNDIYPGPSNVNHIQSGTEIKGNIKSNGDIRIDGFLEGNLETKGKIVVGGTGKIKGQVRCKNSEVEGEIEGKVFVSELLALKASARIFGDIVSNKLAIEPGCKFTGNCNMTGEESGEKMPLEEQPKEKKS